MFALCQAAFGAIFKFASKSGVSVADFTIARTFFMFLLAQPVIYCMGKHPIRDLPTTQLPVIAFRAVLGVLALAGVTWAMTMIPLSLATIPFKLAPFWASVLGYIINRESVPCYEYIAMVISFAGVLVVMFGGKVNLKSFSDLLTNAALKEGLEVK